jgi:type IV secretory pathway protease TraF
LLAAALALAITAWRARDVVLYNPSPSVPAGFYIRSSDPPAVGAFVTVRARDVAPAYARLRRFVDDHDRFIKRIAAVSRARVCADGNRISIDGVISAERALSDCAGRPLPRWEGCRTLDNEVFLLGDTPDSFDGRYWGPTPVSAIEGVWRPL